MPSGSKLPSLSHHHSASYTYGTSDTQSAFSSGLSQERSTASPLQSTGLNTNPFTKYTWPPQSGSSAPLLKLLVAPLQSLSCL
ncbi:uncharacterized protein I206_104415 [Kwoniella pini CBS 10737]|uniref:Uncharacterized protein n=1 Tax=Kwoniella pini CBS 10737 TaxID=1296096 RepID=A0AAJ8L4I4_9TREE